MDRSAGVFVMLPTLAGAHVSWGPAAGQRISTPGTPAQRQTGVMLVSFRTKGLSSVANKYFFSLRSSPNADYVVQYTSITSARQSSAVTTTPFTATLGRPKTSEVREDQPLPGQGRLLRVADRHLPLLRDHVITYWASVGSQLAILVNTTFSPCRRLSSLTFPDLRPDVNELCCLMTTSFSCACPNEEPQFSRFNELIQRLFDPQRRILSPR